MLKAYKEQVAGLIDGGVHILMVETIFDSLNAKAALAAIDEYYEESGCPRPQERVKKAALGHTSAPKPAARS